MTVGSESVEMAESHDMHHEPHNGQHPPPSMTTHNNKIRINTITILDKNNNVFNVKKGVRMDKDKIKGDKTNTRGKNGILEIY